MRKAVISVFLSNLTGAGLGFLVSVALARVLDISWFGRINLLFSLITILYTVADFGFSNCLVIYYNRHRDSAAVEVLDQINRFYLRFLAAVSVLGLLMLPVCGRLYHLSVTESAVVFVSFLMFSMYRYMTSLHQARGDWRRFNLLTVLNNVLKFAVVLTAIAALSRIYPLFDAYRAALWGYLLYSALLFVICMLFTRKLLGFADRFTPGEQKEFLGLLYPIGVAGIFIIITMRFDSLVIEKYLGSEQLGIYAAANTLALVFPLITGSLMNVLIRESAGDKESYLVRVMAGQRRYLLALGAVLAVAWGLSAPVIGLLFGDAYLASVQVFRILLIAYIGGIFFTPMESYFYSNDTRTILFLKLFQMLAVVVLSLLLIGSFGLQGVAASVVISRLLGWVYIYSRSSIIVGRAV
ncbi:MAG: hypothetical protein A2075_16430 [Geobacteraceae bacterium GWC2_58_44]|nr:MAG: hypothetical protein A2075_16430 [Geobacteraceae bacterium GWC2_58_44]HBG07026.1 hypothetical protein [Geobacter sp.]